MNKSFVRVISTLVIALFCLNPMCSFAEAKAVTKAVQLTSENAKVALSYETKEYTGSAMQPEVSVTYINEGESLLSKGVDYKVSYSKNTNVGTATVKVTGINKYAGTLSKKFTITPANIEKANVSYIYDNAYKKTALEPLKKITLNGKTLVAGQDYIVKYKNNRYPGVGNINIKGTKNYIGEINKEFVIAMVKKMEVKSATTSSVDLKWSSCSNVTGYILYQYIDGQRVKIKALAQDKISHKVTNLKPNTEYRFAVRSYCKTSTSTKYGTLAEAEAYTGSPTKIISKSGGTDKVNVKWEAKDCVGYDIATAVDLSYKNGYTLTHIDSPATEASVSVKGGMNYYVRVRPIYERNGVKMVGPWTLSSKVSTKTTNSGWLTLGSNQYFLKNGKAFTGQHKIKANALDGAGPDYYFDGNGILRAANKKMWDKVKNSASATRWILIVDTTANRTCIYKGSKGEWSLHKIWLCTTGKKTTPTYKGDFTIGYRGYEFGDENFTAFYYTQINKRQLFHSILYETKDWKKGKKVIRDGRLGINASHGCVRLADENCIWVFRNITKGSRVFVI